VIARTLLPNVDWVRAQAIAPKDVDWGNALETTLLVSQRFAYEYPGPIEDLLHRLVMVPRGRHGDQRRVSHKLTVSPNVEQTLARDAFGNSVVTVRARRVYGGIAFELESLVRRSEGCGPHVVEAALLHDERLLTPTPLTAPDERTCDLAADFTREYGDVTERAQAIASFVFRAMTYTPGATNTETTAAEALTLGRGVCQDYAHVMLALARRAGIASRYVSGHMLGEGATHAWVEAIVPGSGAAVALAFDPTNDRGVTLGYVTVAVGRDYADVAPTSGVFTAPYGGELSAESNLEIRHVRYAA
jgi:transglutaminase-like putative cysteine protease